MCERPEGLRQCHPMTVTELMVIQEGIASSWDWALFKKQMEMNAHLSPPGRKKVVKRRPNACYSCRRSKLKVSYMQSASIKVSDWGPSATASFPHALRVLASATNPSLLAFTPSSRSGEERILPVKRSEHKQSSFAVLN